MMKCNPRVLNGNSPKWLGEGAKGVLVYVGQKPVRLVQKEGCTGAKQGCTGARDSWETLSATGQNTFLHPLLTILQNYEVSGLCSRHSGSQSLGV